MIVSHGFGVSVVWFRFLALLGRSAGRQDFVGMAVWLEGPEPETTRVIPY